MAIASAYVWWSTKPYQPADPSAQLMQVALYADLVHHQRQEPVDAAVYCIFPEFQVYFYDWDQLRSMRDMALLPHLQRMQDWLSWQPDYPDPPPKTYEERLCPLCPQQNTCQTFFLAGEQASPVKSPSVEPIVTPTPEPPPTPTPAITPPRYRRRRETWSATDGSFQCLWRGGHL